MWGYCYFMPLEVQVLAINNFLCYNSDMSERMKLTHQVVDELRDLKERPPFQPTADIDAVWVLSAPGTYKEVSQDGIYKGVSADKKNIDYGIRLVYEITALRLGKNVDEVTKEDVESEGPVLYYNGEDAATAQTNYPQNLHLQEMVADPEFPLPASNLKIGHIEIANTPAQVSDFAEFSRDFLPGSKVAVVSLIQHAPRVSRYLQHQKDSLPEGVIFLNAPTPETDKTVGKVLREVRKIADYAEKGDLSREPFDNF